MFHESPYGSARTQAASLGRHHPRGPTLTRQGHARSDWRPPGREPQRVCSPQSPQGPPGVQVQDKESTQRALRNQPALPLKPSTLTAS
jgi:hypothetical protein